MANNRKNDSQIDAPIFDAPETEPAGQTIGEVKESVESKKLVSGASPAEARNAVSRLGFAMNRHRDMQESLVELVEVQDSLTLADFLGAFRNIVKESNLFETDKPSILSKLETCEIKIREAVARVAAKNAKT